MGFHAWADRVQAHATHQWRGQLSAMAEDRATFVDNWVRERLGDARMVAAYPTVVFLASGEEGPPYPFPREQGAKGHLTALLQVTQATYGHEAAWLVGAGPEAPVLASTTADPPPRDLVEQVLEQGAVRIGFRGLGGLLRVVAAAPVWPDVPGKGRPIGVVLFAMDPERNLFTLLRREPEPTRTGETLLVRREGPDVFFLSPLRHAADRDGTLRLPLSTQGLAASAALQGREFFGTFRDYRGVAVLAAGLPLREAADWGLVVKIDREEALEAAWGEIHRISALGGALLLAVAGVGFGLWRQHTTSTRLALARSEARFGQLLEHAADAILFVRPDGRIAKANRRAEELYGYSRDELLALRVHDLYPPDQVDLIGTRMQAVREQPGLVFEAEHLARDGTRLPVEAASRFLETDEGQVFVSIIRDVRERKAAERRIAFLNRTLRTLSEINQLMVRVPDRERLLHGACNILVEHGGFRMAWVGFRDPQTGWIVPAAWAGHEEGYLSETWISADENSPRGRGPAGVALREGRTVTVIDTAAAESFEPWREAASTRGYRSVAASPIRKGGEPTGVLVLYSGEPAVFEPQVLALVEKLASDVGLGLEAIDARREREEAATALAESRGFLETLVNSSSAAIFTLRPDGRVGEVWNPAAERLFGWSREEAIGRPAPFVPVDRQDEFRALRQRVLAGQLITDLEISRVRRDGSPVELRLAASPLRDPEGRVVAILAVALDATERKRAETERVEAERTLRQLSAAVEQSPVAIMITDVSGTIEYVNPSFSRQTGYAREEVLGQNPRILKSGHHPPAFYADLYATLGRGQEWHGEMLNRRKNGELYWEYASISPIVDERGRARQYLAVKEDITERRRADEELRHTQERLLQSQKLEAVGRLAGGVAHDFNNLLGVIIGHGELAEAVLPAGHAVRDRLGQVLDAARRAGELTRQLLAFSRRQVLQPRVVDPNAVVVDLEKMLRRLIGEDVRLVTRLDPAVDRVRVDPGQMGQVLMNLAVNARDAMPRGGVLTIATSNWEADDAYARAHRPMAPGPYVQILVSDDGCGMDEAVREHVFEPFFTTKPETAGSGLGLSTVYGIVKQSGGYIWIDSAPGRGSTITIHLPRVTDAIEGVRRAGGGRPSGGTETILVVEDQDGLRDLICEMLRETGYEVLSAADGRDALSVAEAHAGPIHLLVTDVIMPGISGRELAERLRHGRAETRVLFVSGYTSDVIARSGALQEGTDLLEKPFGREALLRRVREALSTPQGS